MKQSEGAFLVYFDRWFNLTWFYLSICMNAEYNEYLIYYLDDQETGIWGLRISIVLGNDTFLNNYKVVEFQLCHFQKTLIQDY